MNVARLMMFVVLFTCASCESRDSRVHAARGTGTNRAQESPGSEQRLLGGSQSGALQGTDCRIPLPNNNVEFSDCTNKDGQAILGNDCYVYQLRDSDGTDNKPACIPGPLDLSIEGPHDDLRGALVDAEVVAGDTITRVDLRIRRISLWPDGEVHIGDVVGQVLLESGQFRTLELSASVRAGKGKAAILSEAQLSAWKAKCSVILNESASFTECVSPPKTHPTVPDCYTYDIVPAGRDTQGELCFPGDVYLQVTGAIGYFRSVLVHAKVTNNTQGAPDAVLLQVQRIANWPDSEFQVGDVIATIRLRDSKPSLLEFGPKLRSKTGAKQLKLFQP